MVNPKTVYVIDDDEAVRDSTEALLASHNIPVRSYPSAQGFLADFGGLDVGCIILDLHMPGMGGLELLQILRQRGFLRTVIIVSGKIDPHLKEIAGRLGSTYTLHKPADDEQLVEMVRTALPLGN